MIVPMPLKATSVLAALLVLSSCGPQRSSWPEDTPTPPGVENSPGGFESNSASSASGSTYTKSSIWDVFGPNKAERTVNVNKYLWNASLDILNFLPIQEVDPFTGVIATGYGTPPGGGRSYRATVHISDPALEARSLNVSLQTRNGPVSAATSRAVEDAILSRARQLRISDDKL